MVTETKARNTWVVVISILCAILLMLLPLPDSLHYARPEWVVMTLIYWAMALPQRVGIAFAWVTGLMMDVAMGITLGTQAFSYALAIYLVARFHQQLRQYPLWQQGLMILSLVLLVHTIRVMSASIKPAWEVWLPAVTSTILWPVVYAILRKVRRAFQVS